MEEGYDSTIYREGRSPTSRDNNYEYSNPNNSEEEDEEESSYNHQTKCRKHAVLILEDRIITFPHSSIKA